MLEGGQVYTAADQMQQVKRTTHRNHMKARASAMVMNDSGIATLCIGR